MNELTNMTDDITQMTDDPLMVHAQSLLESLHEYELLCLHGSSRREREHRRAVKDRLIAVCYEIGVRHVADRFKGIITEHNAAYEANLKQGKNGGEDEEKESDQGRLSWWN